MKLITFSLWGNDPKYVQGAIRNAELAPKIYPGWTCRFYVGNLDQSTNKIATFGGLLYHTLNELALMDHVEVITLDETANWTGMFWRFRPAAEDDVEAFISRDCDSRLGEREARAVEDWLKGPQLIHVMRDHPYHSAPILGGMWGAKRHAIPDMLELMDKWQQEDRWQTDQEFLRDVIWPAYGYKTLVHDDWVRSAGTEPFPTPRNGDNFVGAIIGANEERLHPEHHEML